MCMCAIRTRLDFGPHFKIHLTTLSPCGLQVGGGVREAAAALALEEGHAMAEAAEATEAAEAAEAAEALVMMRVAGYYWKLRARLWV
jgi:hypothetical protein